MKSRDAETRIETARFTIEGKSRAGNETWFRIRELGIALDIGRCPDTIVSVPHVFVTHTHLDHALGIPFYAAQRKLHKLPPGRVYVPQASAAGLGALMTLHEQLENTTYPLDLVGLAPGDEVSLRRDLAVRAHHSSHRVPANGYEFLDVRTRMDPSLLGLPGEEIGRLKKEAPERFRTESTALLYYTGDTDAAVFDGHEAIFRAEVLMIECSFTAEGEQDRAVRYQHIHVDDLFERAALFENELIVLTHFSLRDSPGAVHRLLSRRAPERLRERIRLALPDPFTRL